MTIRLREALQAFQDATKRDITVQHLIVFLAVGDDEDKTQADYTRMLSPEGEPPRRQRSTMSRHLLDLSVELRTKETGYGLIEFEVNVLDRRQNLYRLTPKGRAVYDRIRQLLGDG